MDGFLCFNKPCGPSSFQIIHKLRKALGIKKIGHAGTLDPHATGLLVIAVGNATRLLQYIPNEPKVYRFSIQFGTETDTLDSEGKTTRSGGSLPEPQQLIQCIDTFKGEILQAPPQFSAVKTDGVRAYSRARSGEQFSLPPRPVFIYSLNLLHYNETEGQALLEVQCSGGTYVRSLVRDIASSLHTYGFASSIHRVSSGTFTLNHALTTETLENAGKYIMPIAEIFSERLKVQVTERQKMQLSHGMDIIISENTDSGIVFAFSGDNILAVLQKKEGTTYHPVTVFHTEG
ncbi:MAG: tRNA pseudouridine(55) synthase TruB [Fibrobacter sp.]|nr:tRNA pseudouridine(55) synthase TruB [Fibrobacter sp.]